MRNLIPADNQPIDSRFGDNIWVTDLITPENPDVMLRYLELTENLHTPEDKITALWRYVANLPYNETIRSKLIVNGYSFSQSDTWFYPAETMRIKKSNCANRSFLLASLLKNGLPAPGQVYCVAGNLAIDSIGAHAWVELNLHGRDFILETTQPNLGNPLLPVGALANYEAVVAFDENAVYTVYEGANVRNIINAHFGVCAIPFLEDYICEKCLRLGV